MSPELFGLFRRQNREGESEGLTKIIKEACKKEGLELEAAEDAYVDIVSLPDGWATCDVALKKGESFEVLETYAKHFGVCAVAFPYVKKWENHWVVIGEEKFVFEAIRAYAKKKQINTSICRSVEAHEKALEKAKLILDI